MFVEENFILLNDEDKHRAAFSNICLSNIFIFGKNCVKKGISAKKNFQDYVK